MFSFQDALYERDAASDIPHESEHEVEESNRDTHAPPNTVQGLHPSNCTKTKVGHTNFTLPDEYMVEKEAHIEKCDKANQSCTKLITPDTQVANQGKSEVFLFSANPRNKNKMVAKGSLVSKDKTYIVGRNMLGDEYYAVSVFAVTKTGNERLPRPYENCQMLQDAIGYVIAWPRSHVKRAKRTTANQPTNNRDG